MPPRYSLERVKEIARRPRGLWLQRTRALVHLQARAGSARAAYDEARRILEALQARDFAETVQLTVDVADVYGVTLGGAGWYLKFYIDENGPEVSIISCHPLERPLRTRGGLVSP